MPRTEAVHDLRIIPGTLVGIVNDHADRRAGGAALEHARKDLHFIRLAALGGMSRLAGLAAVQVPLQVRLGQCQPGRTTVNDTAECRPVTLAKAGDCEQFAEGIT